MFLLHYATDHLHVQIRDQETKADEQNEELRNRQYKLEDLEETLSRYQQDNEQLRERVKKADAREVESQSKLQSLNNSLQQKDSDLQKLNDEKIALQNGQAESKDELERLRALEKNMRDFVKEIEAVNVSSVSVNQTMSPSFHWNASPFNTPLKGSDLDTDNTNNNFQFTQQKLLNQQRLFHWIHSSYLRSFCPLLSEKLRNWFNDFSKQDFELSELKSQNQSLKMENQSIKRDLENELNRIGQTQEVTVKLIEDYRAKLQQLEKENSQLKTYQTLFQQVRIILSSIPNINDLFYLAFDSTTASLSATMDRSYITNEVR